MRTMYDGINADAAGIARDFPGAQLVAGYLTGRYAWTAAEWAMFPRSQHVTIVVNGVNAGDVLDVETGDATPGETEQWITMRKNAGLYRPTIYCSLSVVPDVRVGTGKWVLGKDYDLWVADWDGTTMPDYPLAVAKQYRDTPGYDVSAVFRDDWPLRNPPPTLSDVEITVLYGDGTTRRVTFP